MPSSSSSSSPIGDRSVTLRKGITGTHVDGRTHGYLLKLEVIETVDVDPYLFVFQRKPATLPGATAMDEFSNVASPADFDAYSIGTPTDASPFFRRLEAELVFRDIDQLRQAAYTIENDVIMLICTLNQLDQLVEQTEIIESAQYAS